MPELWSRLGELLFPPKRTDLSTRIRGATLTCARCGNEYRSDKRNGLCDICFYIVLAKVRTRVIRVMENRQ